MERVAFAGISSAPVWLALFVGLARALGAPVRLRPRFGPRSLLPALGILNLGMPLAHEAIHGLVARLIGARPRYGLGAGFVYTTFEQPVSRNAYLAIGLSPLLALTGAGLTLLVRFPRFTGQILTFLVGNAAGAAGDVWVAWRVWALPGNAVIRDLADGFAAYLPEE